MKKIDIKKIGMWFLICLFVFIASTFLHECGHGLANKIHGVSVSTGFNRVGNAYKYPSDSDFRAGYDTTQTFLLDFGVPVTLILAVAFTAILLIKKEWKDYSVQFVAAFALCNSIIRLVPCLLSIFMSLFTGELHIEDEIQTGQLLVERFSIDWVIAIPVIFSIAISILCYIFVMKKKRQIQFLIFKGMALSLWLAYAVSFFIENWLDNIIRINWTV